MKLRSLKELKTSTLAESFVTSLHLLKNACLLLQLAPQAAGEGQCRWIWASLFFSAFVTAHLKSRGPEVQDRWSLLKKESVSNSSEILPNVK